MKIVFRKLSELKPYEKNAKKHTKAQIAKVADSIKVFGFKQPLVVADDGLVIVGHGRLEAAKSLNLKEVPCVVADDGLVIVGHGRLEAAKSLNLKEVPCVVADDLTDEQIKAYRLADNKLNESDWDMELVVQELKLLQSPMVELTGFDRDLILEKEEKDDFVPSFGSAKPRAKLGDIFGLGKSRLMCGDSTKSDDVELLLGGEKVDMVFTDPPYNIDYDFSKNGMVETGQRKARFGKIKNDKMSDEDFEKFISSVFMNLFASMKPGASFYISAGRESTMTFNKILKALNFYIAQWLIWEKEHFNISRLSYHPSHEIITFGWKPDAPHSWYGDRKQKDVLLFPRDPEAVHPTQKPVALLAYLMQNSSQRGDLILDLFLGSGSTLIASQKADRVCYGMELDPKYADVILERWENFTGEKAIKL